MSSFIQSLHLYLSFDILSLSLEIDDTQIVERER